MRIFTKECELKNKANVQGWRELQKCHHCNQPLGCDVEIRQFSRNGAFVMSHEACIEKHEDYGRDNQ